MQLSHLDHLVLTVADIDPTVKFYRAVGMQHQQFVAADGSQRHTLTFGQQKINLHQRGREFEPKAERVQAGSADLCFVVTTPLEQVMAELAQAAIDIVEGPVMRTGATGPIRSVYIRGPDGNLIELSNYCSH